jgi:hypothetical protein
MKLDDKWRKGFETFLTYWSSKIQDLESIEDKEIDEETKRIWLTNALMGQKEMDDAVRQAITTELTIAGMAGRSLHQVSWTNFYHIVLSTAKMLDTTKKVKATNQRQSHRAEQNRRNPTGRNDQRGRNPGRGNSFQAGKESTKTFTKYTGSTMEMEVNMIFSPTDWAKLTVEQKKKLAALKRKRNEARNSSNSSVSTVTFPASTVQVNATQVQPVSTPVSVAAAPGTNVRQLLSYNTSTDSPSAVSSVQPPSQLSFGGRTYSLNGCSLKYHISSQVISTRGSLIDGGANGGMSGSDVRIINQTTNFADVTGIADKSVPNLPICTVAGLIETHKGYIIGIFNQYAHHGQGKTVHSMNQMRHFGLKIDDTPRSLGHGKQCIQTPDGYIIPLSIRNGLPFMDMTPPTDNELDAYPHVMFTSDQTWDPQVLDDEYKASDLIIEDDDDVFAAYHADSLNDYGELVSYASHRHIVQPKQHDFHRLKPNFGFVPVDRIQKTLEHTSQYARMDTRLPLRKHFKTRFPAANVSRLNETVATDTFFSDIPAHDDGIYGHGGATMIQLFCGTTSLLTAGYPMKTGDEMAGTLEDFIRSFGAPNALFSDNAKNQIGKAVREILRMYAIKDFQCEPHHQHQNPAERRIQEVKKLGNHLMDRTNTPPHLWLLCLLYVIYLLNRLSTQSIDWKTPIEAATGQQPDVSALIAFRWFEPVYFKSPGLSDTGSQERTGRIVGIAEHQGDALTFLVLDDITAQVVARSELRSALDSANPNLRAENPAPQANFHADGGEALNPAKPIMSSSDVAGLKICPSDLKLPKFLPDELMGITFLRELDDGQTYRAKVARKIMDKDEDNHGQIKFLIEIGEGKFDEILTYNELSDIIEEQQECELKSPDGIFTFLEVKDH